MELWFTEKQTPSVGITCKVLSTLHREKSSFQEIAVLDTEQFGRMLVLDGMVMTTIKDEFTYHEMLVHVPLNTHPHPRKVLIVGGGDGGTIREVLRHPEIEKVTLVEIDKRVTDVSKKFLPELASAFDHPKVEACFEDGIQFVKDKEAVYDVILIDSPEPIGQAARLFSADFYADIYRALRADGLFAAQTESPFFNQDLIAAVTAGIQKSFPITKLYLSFVPTYPSGLWSFTIGSKKYDPEAVDKDSIPSLPTRYYNADMHFASFNMPEFVKEILAGGR